MTKYWHVLAIAIQDKLVYRANFVFRAVFGLIPLIATISLWRAIYADKTDSVAGYTLGEMISYYLIVMLVDTLTAVADDDWQIAADIKDGKISQFLVQPIDYLTYRLCLFSAGRLVYTLVALGPAILFILWHRDLFQLPAEPVIWVYFGFSVLLTALLQFFISYTMALLAFWVLEVSTFIFILFAFEYMAGGHLFPLDILPPLVLKILYLTPFPYLLFFPVNVYLGRITGVELWQGLIVQACWVAAAYGLARFVWGRGLRHYSAVGG